jgi:hypothetical protein
VVELQVFDSCASGSVLQGRRELSYLYLLLRCSSSELRALCVRCHEVVSHPQLELVGVEYGSLCEYALSEVQLRALYAFLCSKSLLVNSIIAADAPSLFGHFYTAGCKRGGLSSSLRITKEWCMV